MTAKPPRQAPLSGPTSSARSSSHTSASSSSCDHRSSPAVIASLARAELLGREQRKSRTRWEREKWIMEVAQIAKVDIERLLDRAEEDEEFDRADEKLQKRKREGRRGRVEKGRRNLDSDSSSSDSESEGAESEDVDTDEDTHVSRIRLGHSCLTKRQRQGIVTRHLPSFSVLALIYTMSACLRRLYRLHRHITPSSCSHCPTFPACSTPSSLRIRPMLILDLGAPHRPTRYISFRGLHSIDATRTGLKSSSLAS